MDKFKIACPSCGAEVFRLRLGDMEPGRPRICPRCNTEVTFEGGRRVEKQLNDALKKAERKLERALKIKLKF